VSDAVLARVVRLDDATRAAVEQLSVVPTAVGLDLAHALLGERLDALAVAEARGIITSRTSGLMFRHELARQAVEESLPPLRRRTLHRAVIAALQTQPAPDLARLVHHAVEADDSMTVSRFAPLAGREAAAAGSHRQALSHLSAALRHGHRLAEPELARLVDEHAWELYNAGHFAEARRGGERAVRLRRQGADRVALAEALVRLSRHRFMAGDPDGADAAAEEAVALLGATGPQEAMAFAATYLGATRALTERSAEAPTILRRAHRLATSVGRADLVALCRNYESGARDDLGDEARLAMLRESLDTALVHGFHEVAARGYTNLGELCFRFYRLDELERCVAEGLVFAQERGFSSHAHNLEVHRGLLAMRRGDWQSAVAALREAAHGAERGMPNAAGPYGRLLARRGAPEAEALLEQAWEAACGQRSVTELAIAGCALAEWGWLVGRTDRVEAVVRAWRPHAARPTAAPAWAEILRYAARAGVPVEPPDGDVGPWAAGLRGDWRGAAESFGAVGDPYERALELGESGEVAPTVEALHTLEDLGAAAAAHLVRRRLRTLGVMRVPRRSAASTRANPAGLTDRQLDVHALLAKGLTNAEIAERLVLSVRTVDSHVAAILDKLGVRNRRDAARLLSR
jgi:DNA-binding CsgD family transcriptional regulator/tetratricopeptide (TPR) repeat protein